MLIAGIAVAGALGAPARYLVDRFVQERADGDLPVGTLVVNVTGSFVLGLIVGFALYHAFANTPRAILGTGFCGAYTTFSAFAYETVRLGEERAFRTAFQNVGASVVLPALAGAAGLALASL
jgi:CrcB protein